MLALEEGFLYDQAVYHCAYQKDSKTLGKVSIFASGKMISTGTKSFKSAKHDLNYAYRKLADLGLIEPRRIKVKLQNIVATAAIGEAVDFQKLTKLPNVMYEPDQFPGAIYYAKDLEGASILVFANGKVVLAGLKNEHMLEVGRQVIRNLALLATT
jgi:transcription initiation factor TFIID TATA-box-binding protein